MISITLLVFIILVKARKDPSLSAKYNEEWLPDSNSYEMSVVNTKYSLTDYYYTSSKTISTQF